MRLNGLFDVLRGWPREGAIDETFPVHKTGGTLDTLVPGMVVYVNTDGELETATTPNRTSADAVATWIVVEGTDDFSGEFMEKAVCLRSNAMFRLDGNSNANFATATYAVGTKLSFDTGLWKEAGTNDQVIGEVVKNDVATDGTLVVMYTAADSVAF